MDGTIWSTLAIGTGLGLLHAFDADHILAVSSLASRDGKRSRGLAYAFRWALGHGFALLCVGVATLLVRAEIPAAAFSAAEAAVGVVLIAAGVSVLVSLIRRDVRLRPHAHRRVSRE